MTRRRYSAQLLAGAVALLLLAETLVRVVAVSLPEPLHWYSRVAQEKIALATSLEGADVVFVGDSSTGAALDPSIVAGGCPGGGFNAAVPGSGTLIWSHWLSEVINPRLKPQTVLIGVTPRMLDSSTDVDESSWESYRNARAVRDDPLGRAYRGASDALALVRHSPNFNDPEQWRNVIAETSLVDLDRPWLDLDAHGMAPAPRERYLAESPSAREPFVLDQAAVDRLIALVAALADEGRKAMVVLLPVTSDWMARYTHPPGLATALADLPIVDVSDLDSPEFFYDPNHANAEGAERISSAVVERATSLC